MANQKIISRSQLKQEFLKNRDSRRAEHGALNVRFEEVIKQAEEKYADIVKMYNEVKEMHEQIKGATQVTGKKQ